jgi:arylsulfatase A-like enzyme
MAISWPAKIRDKGGIRWEFHHVVDIVPNSFDSELLNRRPRT